MQILLEYTLCKQVSIYSGDMSHLLRYHGYSISSANSIKHHQLFAIFCTCACTTEWWFPSSGRSFLSVLARTGANGHLKSLYGQEASMQQKQNFKCYKLLDKIFGTFLWCFAQTSSTIILSRSLSNWLVSCYIMWFLPWKSCPFCRQGHIVSLAEFPRAVGVRPRHPEILERWAHSGLHPVLLAVGLRNVFTLGLFTIPYNWVLSYRAPQDWGPNWVGRAVQQHWKAQS